jgi:ABC-type bacteriocin/lantibiotic exporter with double-glycine peptidase domain
VKLTSYAQEEPHTRVVACLRMVAEYYGLTYTEAERLPDCQTTLDGTTPEALVEAAHKIGLTAQLTFGDPTGLSLTIHQQQPLIVYLGIPASSSELEIHAVVVSDLTVETVT